ncbi:RNA polymerase factor sigma-54 [Thermodesulfobacteriota bacterium]
MALELRQSLNLSQQLIMTPQLQQAIKLLQLSRMELLDTIYQEMEENPVLEEQQTTADNEDEGQEDFKDETGEAGDSSETGEEFSEDFTEVTVSENTREDVDWENYLSEYNSSWAETSYEYKEAPSFDNITSSKTNLNSHLMWQLGLSNLSDEQRNIGEQIIGNIDEDGYLDIPIDELCGIVGASREEVLKTLEYIQNFDPVGVGARDARESLLIQARFQGQAGTHVEKIISDHLGNLENKKYDIIAKTLSISIPEVQEAVATIQCLEPKPGRLYTEDETVYIVPDIYVFKVGDEYQILLNDDGMPKLRVNAYYKEVLGSKKELTENAKAYIQDKLRSAAWLIKSIHQRQRTIYKVTESIISHQKEFLKNGIAHLNPLVLRTVAEDIQMHESTVSRVTTNKYVHTPQGVFELKFFFNSSVSGVEGGAVASESVKEHIRKIIKSEKPAKPFSDQEIALMLKKLKINVARRTVAKYRESMGILPSRKRRNPY